MGALVTIMGFLGCCGAWKQSAWMLGTFFAFLFIIFLVEIGVGIMVYFHVSDTKITQTMTDLQLLLLITATKKNLFTITEKADTRL